ncbi:hypothetical protein XENTR_v10024990 [Xenopus tropicalis]|nr:hypothetical protein XENTR_v10024990 [Xenopus tropicalis]
MPTCAFFLCHSLTSDKYLPGCHSNLFSAATCSLVSCMPAPTSPVPLLCLLLIHLCQMPARNSICAICLC